MAQCNWVELAPSGHDTRRIEDTWLDAMGMVPWSLGKEKASNIAAEEMCR